MKIDYPARFEPDEDGRVFVTFRDFPEAATDGADMTEAMAEAVDLLDSVLSFRIKYREAIPSPSKARKGEVLIAPDTAIAMKAALYVSLKRSGMSIADLSRALKVDNREAQRIMNPHHATRLARLSEALRATGSRAVVELRAHP